MILKGEDLKICYDYAYQALAEAEQKLSRPVSILEILDQLKKVNEAAETKLPANFVWKAGKLGAFLFDLFRNDEILTDRVMNWYSINP